MKSIYRHIALRLAALSLVLAALSATSGCSTLTEDNSDCPQGLYLRFFYTYHTGDDGCRFSAQVNSLDIFIYNAGDGSLATRRRVPASSLDARNGLKLDLSPGDYHIVAWGNYDEQAHLIAVHDIYTQMQLRLKTQGGDFGSHTALFHADLQVRVESMRRTDADVYMTKNTNAIHVIVTDNDNNILDPALFPVTMTGFNSIYNYDNSLAAESQYLPLNYIPSYSRADHDTQTDFVVYRLFSDESDGVRLKISTSETPSRVLHNLWLSREILNTIDGIDTDQNLDREDDYTLIYKVCDDGGAWTLVSIFINGWEIILQNSSL